MSGLIPPSRVRQGLTEQFLVAGVEPRLLLLNVGFFLFVFVLFRSYMPVVAIWAVLAFFIHQALKPASKRDPFLRRIYLRYQMQADRYEPYPAIDARLNKRPVGFGHGTIQ